MYKKLIIVMAVLASSLVLGGCLEDSKVTLAEAGVYKGPVDPLLQISNSAELAARFNTIQTDR